MKKITILQIPNAKNNGSAMMAINTINFYYDYFDKKVEFFCDFSTQDDYNRITSELNKGTAVTSLNISSVSKGNNSIQTLLNRIKHIKNVSTKLSTINPDGVIVLGGDDFSEYYSGWKIVIRLYYMYVLSKKFPIFLMGHTIGPFHSWRKFAFKILMKKCRIITRDEPSFDYCTTQLKVNHVENGHDLAWLNLPKQKQELNTQILDKYLLKENDFIVIIPSALVSHYTNDQNNYFEMWVELLNYLQKNAYNIALMPHVFKDNQQDDIWAIQEIKKRIINNKSIIYIEDRLLPSQCRSLLSVSRFSISCRMHSAVSTLQTGKPTIALSYSSKYSGVIGNDMNLSELVIESSSSELWPSVLVNQIINKIDFIDNNYTLLKAKIENRVEVIKKEQNDIMKNYGKIIDNTNGKPFDY